MRNHKHTAQQCGEWVRVPHTREFVRAFKEALKAKYGPALVDPTNDFQLASSLLERRGVLAQEELLSWPEGTEMKIGKAGRDRPKGILHAEEVHKGEEDNETKNTTV